MHHTYTCLIPFYNEGNRVLSTLQVISKSRLISHIVCIDDGSTDNASMLIKKNFPNVKLIKLPQNKGKANAFKEGLTYANTTYILLFDADLYNIQLSEIEAALKKMDTNENIDMIILRRVIESKFLSAIRHDIVMSGQRILKTYDLIRVFGNNPKGYAIESAINMYMIKNNKKVFWMPLRTKNPQKFTKMGFGRSLKLYLKTFYGYFSSSGLAGYFQQIFTFCKEHLI